MTREQALERVANCARDVVELKELASPGRSLTRNRADASERLKYAWQDLEAALVELDCAP